MLTVDRVRDRVPHHPLGLAAPEAAVAGRLRALKSRSLSTRGPSTARIAGSTTIDATAASAHDRDAGVRERAQVRHREDRERR